MYIWRRILCKNLFHIINIKFLFFHICYITIRFLCLTACRFDSCQAHQTVEIRTLYQSVKGSDFYYILTIQILIISLKNTNIEISGDKTLTGFISFFIYFYPYIRQNNLLLIKCRHQNKGGIHYERKNY